VTPSRPSEPWMVTTVREPSLCWVIRTSIGRQPSTP
jgi:hypothetical protein